MMREIETLAIIDKAEHILYIEKVPTDVLNEKYNGNEEDYIIDVYRYDSADEFQWDYITEVNYVDTINEKLEIKYI